MGFIEETGAAQHYRDARITTIYEGTTGIQANDLIGRKTARDGGAVAQAIAGRDRQGRGASSPRAREPALQAIGVQLAAATSPTCRRPIEWIVPAYRPAAARSRTRARWPTSSCGVLVAGGWQMGRAALVAADRLAAARATRSSCDAKIATARFYADALLPQASALAHTLVHGGESALALAAEEF